MRPGAALEMIEEDLQFPFPNTHPVIRQAYYDLFTSRFINISPLRTLPNHISMFFNGLHIIEFEGARSAAKGIHPWQPMCPTSVPTDADAATSIKSDKKNRSRSKPPRKPPPSSTPPVHPSSKVSSKAVVPSVAAATPPPTLPVACRPPNFKVTEPIFPLLRDPAYISMYQGHLYAFIRAAGPEIRANWLRKGHAIDMFDKLWRFFERRVCTISPVIFFFR